MLIAFQSGLGDELALRLCLLSHACPRCRTRPTPQPVGSKSRLQAHRAFWAWNVGGTEHGGIGCGIETGEVNCSLATMTWLKDVSVQSAASVLGVSYNCMGSKIAMDCMSLKPIRVKDCISKSSHELLFPDSRLERSVIVSSNDYGIFQGRYLIQCL